MPPDLVTIETGGRVMSVGVGVPPREAPASRRMEGAAEAKRRPVPTIETEGE